MKISFSNVIETVLTRNELGMKANLHSSAFRGLDASLCFNFGLQRTQPEIDKPEALPQAAPSGPRTV